MKGTALTHLRRPGTSLYLSCHVVSLHGSGSTGGRWVHRQRAMVTFLFRRRIPGIKILSVDESLKTRIAELVRARAVRRKLAAAQLEAEIRRREEVLRRTFRRYLSPRLQPSQVVPLLNEYFSLLTEITFRHDGTVFHMAGDCLMLGFGVPLEQSDSPCRAVRAAQEMLESFRELAHSWKERYGVDAGLGIGINEGDVVAGNIGSSSYMSYTLIGDTVNVAARLCQRARAGEMLFSRTVKQSLDALGLDIGATPLPPLQVRGRSGSIDIFCVPVAKRLQVTALPVAI